MSLFSWKVVFFLVSPHLLVFDYIREKKEAVLSLFDLLYLPPHERFFFFLSKKLLFEMFQEDQEDRHLRMTIFFVASISPCNARIRFTAK